jgi:hypothetical protein
VAFWRQGEESGSQETPRWRKPDSNHWSREGARCPRVVVLVHADFSAGANATDKSDLESLRRAGTDGSNPASSGAAVLRTR